MAERFRPRIYNTLPRCQFNTNIKDGGHEDKQSIDILENLFLLFFCCYDFLSAVFSLLFFLERCMNKSQSSQSSKVYFGSLMSPNILSDLSDLMMSNDYRV